ncbi:PREDICTED: olfactory receptor 11G2-like [Gekko japonicus]|uniref:Olfactory receptor n=1 Tax=Gekko japonicus TaxID=146911 RepID=A0ABM1KEH0_GEKJA|nr:PREDICTED: olfactory receptor 11G2-like [Gekko japonicus]
MNLSGYSLMVSANGTRVQEFILLGFGVGQQGRFLLLIFFILLYVLSMAENLTIIVLVVLDTHLSRLPMYILLSNFSCQFYVFFSLGTTESFFLSAMALDRYLAICHPLRYPQIMSKDFCSALVAACWLLGFLWYIFPMILISRLSFCGPNIIDHFLCDPGPILSLACPPLGIAPSVCQVFMNASGLVNVAFVVLSYSVVILTLTKSSYRGGRRKAFSTISFHLVVVTLYYGSITAIYLVPSGENQSEVTKAVTLFYTAVTPFLNPLIYTLRNDQVKEAVSQLWKRFQTRKLTE